MRHHIAKQTKKLLIGIAGGLVLLVGLAMIPYPGPGWLVVFLGLTILGTEFMWAKGLLERARGKYDQWRNWLKRQPRPIQAIFLLLTGVVILLTLWLLNTYGFLGELLQLDWPWLRSPLF